MKMCMHNHCAVYLIGKVGAIAIRQISQILHVRWWCAMTIQWPERWCCFPGNGDNSISGQFKSASKAQIIRLSCSLSSDGHPAGLKSRTFIWNEFSLNQFVSECDCDNILPPWRDTSKYILHSTHPPHHPQLFLMQRMLLEQLSINTHAQKRY